MPSFPVNVIDHKLLVLSGHSFLPCDQDFGIIEKEKRFHKDIFTPCDWERVNLTARKRNPFHLVKMGTEDIKDITPLEKLITNRKFSLDKSKIKWLNIQLLRFDSQEPYIIKYKYSNNEEAEFSEIDISKRNTLCKTIAMDLEPLFPEGRAIERAKYKDLQELKQFIPPINHKFYDNLKHSAKAVDEDIVEDEEKLS